MAIVPLRHGRPPNEAEITETCGSLVAYDRVSGIVTLAHDVVREFLETRYYMHLLTQTTLAITSLTYLLFPPFDEGECQNEESLKFRMEKYPFSQYEAQYWSQHMKGKGERDPKASGLLLTLAMNPKKFTSMVQLSKAETSVQWQVEPRDKNKQLIHVTVENGLTEIFLKVIQHKMKMVTSLSY